MNLSYIKRLPIMMQLSLLIGLIIIVMFLIMANNYFRAVDVVKKDNSEYLQGISSQLNQAIASNSAAINKIAETVAYNGPIVQKYLSESDPVEQFEAYRQLRGYLSDMLGMKEGILDIALVGTNGSFFNSWADADSLSSVAKKIPTLPTNYYLGLERLKVANLESLALVAGAPIYSTTEFNQGNNRLGTVLIVFDIRALFGKGVPVTTSNGAEVYMTDREGHVFYTNDGDIGIGNQMPEYLISQDRTDYLFNRESIPSLEGAIVIAIPKKVLLYGLNTIRKQQLIIIALALTLLVVPLLFVVNNILQPLKKLMRLMSEVRLGQKVHLGKRIEVDGYAEMIIVAARFNDMMAEIEELTDRLLESKQLLYESELVKRRAELSYLQSQINPHFLYNTLESIKGLAADEGSTKIFDLTKSLGLFFRFSIKGPDMVTLDRELTIIKNYVYIHQIRFGERLEVEYDIHPDCLSVRIPKMILQPIVENAINHGIEPLRQKGTLLIKGYTDESSLYLTVQDNGTGIPVERLDRMRQLLEASPMRIDMNGENEDSIGLMNVQDRIRLKFGPEYGIQMTSNFNEGTLVVLRLPLRSE